ncbi:MAG TPA: response regulator, partial [Planctomycetes bacterium]|nr:response regulator [Planctomycetota bacterium]
LRSIFDDEARHQRVSVAVVDYDMPKMTGVEFCRAISGLPVKRILLTGKAGLETAISAFNEGVIDCFLQKQDANVSAALRREIKRLQHQYFEEISNPIRCALDLQQPCFFFDPNFIDLFEDTVEKYDIVEHYICAWPPGVMMRDAEGLLRGTTAFDLSAAGEIGDEITIRRAVIVGDQLQANVSGAFGPRTGDLTYRIAVADLGVALPDLPGPAS